MINRIFSAAAITLLITFGCQTTKPTPLLDTQTKQNAFALTEIILTEYSRGVQNVYTFLPGKVQTVINSKSSNRTLSSASWNAIEQDFIKLNASKIQTFESEGTLRYSDAALASKIIFKGKNTEYTSAEFDAGNPPTELASIYKKLRLAAK